MACRAVVFGLTATQWAAFESARQAGDEALRAVVEDIEGVWDTAWVCELDKAWDGIHRCLTDGSLSYRDTPLHRVILGPENLHHGGDYIIAGNAPADVERVAAALARVTTDGFRERYFRIDPRDYGMPPSEEDFGYTWDNFEDARSFYGKAAADGRAVIFTVDQ